VSQTIYARVSDELKAAVDEHASTNGKTLANAVADLLDRGLQATADEHSVAKLEQRVRSLQADIDAFQEREKTVSAAYQGLAQRTALTVGSCPNCGKPVSGRDLLVEGRCPTCSANLSPLLGTGPALKKGGLDEGDFKLLLGALGLVLAVALVAQQGGGG
jgi:rubrerythrin